MITEERKKLYIKLLKESFSLREVCLKANISDTTGNYDTLKRLIKEENIDISHFKRSNIGSKREVKPLSYYLNDNVIISAFSLKNKILKEGVKEHKCENPECGLTEWLGKPIPLELHHINGNKMDNRLENLILLCPNCHALTDNFGGKNQKINIKEKKSLKKEINYIDYNEIINDINDGLSINELCSKYNKTRKYIFYILRKINIDKKTVRDEQSRQFKITDNEFDNTKKLILEYKNYSKVGRILGVDGNAISKRFKMRGYPHKIKELIKVLEKE